LAQQLLAAGERVLDVPPKLAARVRLLDSGQINKTVANDVRAVAIAALRARELPDLAVEDQSIVLRVWSRRYLDLGRLRTQAVCRLRTLLSELVPGGVRKQLRTSQAIAVVDRVVANSPIAERNSNSPATWTPTCSASTRNAARSNTASPGQSPRSPPAFSRSTASAPSSPRPY
jgi:hypothetical protein